MSSRRREDELRLRRIVVHAYRLTLTALVAWHRRCDQPPCPLAVWLVIEPERDPVEQRIRAGDLDLDDELVLDVAPDLVGQVAREGNHAAGKHQQQASGDELVGELGAGQVEEVLKHQDFAPHTGVSKN